MMLRSAPRISVAILMLLASLALWLIPRSGHAQGATTSQKGDLFGSVTDSVNAQPMTAADVAVLKDGRVVAHTSADPFGRFEIHDLPPGSYTVEARYFGYRVSRTSVELPASGQTVRVKIRLAPTPFQMPVTEVSGAGTIALDTRSGNQVFREDEYHGSPITTTSQIIQQSLAGAARAPTGEVHIRGQHAEYTYYVDGVPVTTGISGGLNELFTTDVASRIQFTTGGWDAEFGNKNAAIIDVSTKIPSGGFHAAANASGGTFNTNTQGLSFSNHADKFGFFFSGTRQATDMRQEPVMFDTTNFKANNFHNHGEDWFGFGKVQWNPNSRDLVNLDVNVSTTRLDVPYDSTGGVFLDDEQKELNGFENLGWRRSLGNPEGSHSELFAAVFERHGSLKYLPGPNDDPSFIFFPDPTPYNLSEDRNFSSTGAKVDFQADPRHGLEWKVGAAGSFTSGHERFTTTDAAGQPGPTSDSDLKGHDVGGYAQAALLVGEHFELRPGVRYDNHNAPFLGTVDQVSPRLKLSYFVTPATTAWLYYGRLFMPTNVEDLRAITSVADSGVTTQPTRPEKDDFYEVGVVHRFPVGVVTKLSGYYKQSRPGIDDNTVPGSAIVTSVNIDHVDITGIEAVLEIQPPGPLSGYLNFALNHAWGHGPITGGFFAEDNPEGDFDLDHDQRISSVANLTWTKHSAFASATGIYGTGLTNGNEPDASYGTGLFDFNKSIHVDPNFIVNLAGGYTFALKNSFIRPQIFLDNVFDNHYLLKGAFFSGASVGRPFSIQFRLDVGM
ncbi:MAG TPA: TonB-dependent receptor [Candidatus Sulfotelmatobacter sp.]|nr:TonB-dependent receptor [Candidatus Sulfotelmatobacter sp.]